MACDEEWCRILNGRAVGGAGGGLPARLGGGVTPTVVRRGLWLGMPLLLSMAMHYQWYRD